MLQLGIFLIAFYLVIQSAMHANRHATHLAQSYKLSSYTVGFIIIAIISILPENFIAINSALSGVPDVGFGLLLGSNVADLTIIIALMVFISRRSLLVESKILKSHAFYPFILLLPLVLGLDGHISRPEGGALLLAGSIFYYVVLRRTGEQTESHRGSRHLKPFLYLLGSMVLLLVSAHFVVTSATNISAMLGLSPVLIGMLIISLGTTLPELLFSLKAMESGNDELAVGDILGTVLADATVVVGILALVSPFSFPPAMIYVAGIFMVVAAFILFSFMQSDRSVTKKEAFALIALWVAFILIEIIVISN